MGDMAFSVGTSTADLKSDSPTITISSGTATFSVAQTGNIGVGDEVTYNTTSKCYLLSKTSTTVWTVKTATGATPGDVTGQTVNSIKRSFGTLRLAVHGSTPGAADATHLNSRNLTTLNSGTRLLIACYADGNDSSLTRVGHNSQTGTPQWTTNATYYILIFTPKTSVDISSPYVANQNQRHDGKVNGSGYTLTGTTATTTLGNITPRQSYTKIYGIKVIRRSGNWEYGQAIGVSYGTSETGHNNIEIAWCMAVNQDLADASDDGAFLIGCSNSDANHGLGWSVHDNIVVSSSSTARSNRGIHYSGTYQDDSATQQRYYNNTAYGFFNVAAIEINATLDGGADYLPLVKNNYASNVYTTGSPPDYVFAGDYTNANTKFAYNRSDDTTAGTANNNAQCTVANASFVSTTGGSQDLHIQASSALINAGIGVSSDSNVSTLDIDAHTRSGTTCDVGADEIPATTGARLIGDSALIGNSRLVGASALVN